MTGRVFADDSQAVLLIVSKDYGDRPGVHITVRPVQP